jgi:hypothetical protein
MPTLSTYNTRMQLCRLQKIYRVRYLEFSDMLAIPARLIDPKRKDTTQIETGIHRSIRYTHHS